jgi:hypothetical protein
MATHDLYAQINSQRAVAKLERIASERGFNLSPYGDYIKECSAWCGDITGFPVHEKLVQVTSRLLVHVVVDKFEGDVVISEVLV